MTSGKKLGLGVGGGAHAPDWLAAPPFEVPTIDLIWDKRSGRGTGDPALDCYAKAFPLPWHATYKARYLAMMTAVRDHLRAMTFPGLPANSAMNAVTYVRLAGINVTSSETMLPRDEPADVTICGAQNEARWRQAGYTKERIVSAWAQLADGIAERFPNRVLVLSVIAKGAFPRYDSTGRDLYPDRPGTGVSPASHYDAITEDLIAHGQTYGSRFSLQWDALSSTPTSSMDELVELADGGKLSWQLNQRGGNRGSGYNTDPTDPQRFLPVCDAATWQCHVREYQDILDLGIDQYDADFLELHIYDVNVIDASSLESARRALRE